MQERLNALAIASSFYKGKKGFTLRVHAKVKTKLKAKVRELTRRRTVNDYEKWKVDLKRYVVGWENYYKLENMGTYISRALMSERSDVSV